MRAYYNERKHSPYHVRLGADEVVDLINEAADAVNTAYSLGVDLPALAKLHTALNAALSRSTREA
ncbi:hypothetical protein ABZ192_12630 [Streptomyces sp. NPDC006235]|uniref:hypothetical protein n=1 Tax=Streptomyces sp. NPDC006235 TaxID=3156736 RepID=UPI0033B24EA7